MPSPSPRVLPAALLVVVLAAACGGGDLPTVDAAVAEELAGRADVLAGQLEAGDACGARRTAGGLVTVTSEARDAGTVPDVIASEVIATTRDLVRDVSCEAEPEPEPDPAPPPEEDDDPQRGERGKSDQGKDGEGKGRDDDKGGDKEDDKDDD
ncbi:MAG: hypothetical protein KY457_12845 [Actinobacteria bacterium]|nr:hypothetical protein [Actinomycetota bacterium]